MKNLLKLLFLIIIFAISSCSRDSEEIILDNPSANLENFDGDFKAKDFETLEKHGRYFVYSRADVINPILGQTTGNSKLIRGRRGIWTRYRSNVLTSGYVYTLWWAIWNNPENCATPGQCIDTDLGNPDTGVEFMYATGRLIRQNGIGTFYARLKAGDDSGSINALFGLPSAGGLQKGNTFNAQIDLLLRSHGPAIPGMIYEQVSGYAGGCTNPFEIPPFTEIPDEEGECAEIEFSVHLVN